MTSINGHGPRHHIAQVQQQVPKPKVEQLQRKLERATDRVDHLQAELEKLRGGGSDDGPPSKVGGTHGKGDGVGQLPPQKFPADLLSMLGGGASLNDFEGDEGDDAIGDVFGGGGIAAPGERFVPSAQGGVILGADGKPAGTVPPGSFCDTKTGDVYKPDGTKVDIPSGGSVDFFDLPDLSTMVGGVSGSGSSSDLPPMKTPPTKVGGASGGGDTAVSGASAGASAIGAAPTLQGSLMALLDVLRELVGQLQTTAGGGPGKAPGKGPGQIPGQIPAQTPGQVGGAHGGHHSHGPHQGPQQGSTPPPIKPPVVVPVDSSSSSSDVANQGGSSDSSSGSVDSSSSSSS